MGVAKHTRTSPQSLRSGRFVMRNAATGEFAKAAKAKKYSATTIKRKTLKISAEVVLKDASVKTLKMREKMVRKVLEELAGAARQADRLGEAVAFTVEVPPREVQAVISTTPARHDALDEALTAARRRGAQSAAEILKRPEMLPGRAFATLIGTSPETVNQKRKTGELLGLEGTTRGVRFPKWQVTDDGRPLPGLRPLFEILGGDPWTVFRFLTQRHNELAGATALEVMKAGHLEAVEGVARNLKAGVFA